MINRRYTAVHAPFGSLYLTAENGRIVRIDTMKPTIADGLQSGHNPVLIDAASRLKTYFNGEEQAPAIDCLESFSPFQQSIYAYARSIPYGETRTLEESAEQIGSPHAVHAIKMLCLSNPLWIVVPTHRITWDCPDSKGQLRPEEALRRMEARYRNRNLAQPLDKEDKRGYTF